MKKRIVIAGGLLLAAAVFLGLGGAELVARAARSVAQDAQARAWRRMPREKGINIHRYGVRVSVANPLNDASHDRRVVVRDLGPGVKDLVEDRMPASALLHVNGRAPVPLRFPRAGIGTAVVPAEWLDPFQPNEVRVEVWDDQGRWLLETGLAGLFF